MATQPSQQPPLKQVPVGQLAPLVTLSVAQTPLLGVRVLHKRMDVPEQLRGPWPTNRARD